jgi:hypothetical protein
MVAGLFICENITSKVEEGSMARWEMYNPSPSGRNVGDCSVRAIAKALNITWVEAYSLIAAYGFSMQDMPSSNAV